VGNLLGNSEGKTGAGQPGFSRFPTTPRRGVGNGEKEPREIPTAAGSGKTAVGKIKQPRTNTENCLAAVQLLTRQPRTARELSKLLGVKFDTVSRYLRLMEAEGLARRNGLAPRQAVHGQQSEQWVWAPDAAGEGGEHAHAL
jgi:Bacterial regulatory protein, arsR family